MTSPNVCIWHLVSIYFWHEVSFCVRATPPKLPCDACHRLEVWALDPKGTLSILEPISQRGTVMTLRSSIPAEVARHLPPFHWDVERVWRLKAPTTLFALERFEHWLELPFWSSEPGMLFDVKPRDVLLHRTRYPRAWERVVNADLSFPIDLFEGEEGSLKILDGLHRICRAKLASMDTVHAPSCAGLIRRENETR